MHPPHDPSSTDFPISGVTGEPAVAVAQEEAAITFESLFRIEEIQEIQDQFAAATGVASIITRPDGTPLTKPSNFSELCATIIRGTARGCANCYKSGAVIGRHNPAGPIVQRCLSAGLWDAGASITVGGHHVANWLIGQVRDETQTAEGMRTYAREIGADEADLVRAFEAIPYMSREKFDLVAQALFAFANQLSQTAYLNRLQQRTIADLTAAQLALQLSESYNKTLFADSPNPLVVMDPVSASLIDCNNAAARLYGWPDRETLLGSPVREVSAEMQYDGVDSSTATQRRLEIALSSGEAQVFEWRHRRPDGTEWDAEVHLMPFQHGGRTLLQFSLQDITQRKAANDLVRKLSLAVEQSPGAVIIADLNENIEYVNAAFLANTGYGRAEVIGKTPRILHSGKTPASVYVEMWQCLDQGLPWKGEICNRRKDGSEFIQFTIISPLREADGRVTHYVAVMEDITERKASVERINWLAYYDSLTELPNRRLLIDRLQHALVSSSRSTRGGAVLFIDLDNFKILNDSLGHNVGDLLLQQVAQRLLTCVRAEDTVARIGGDEFVVLLENLSDNLQDVAAAARKVGEKILHSVGSPYQLNAYLHHSTPSIGIALFSVKQSDIEELLMQADLAMYQAKAAGRNTLRFFDPEMQAVVSARAALEVELRDALLQRQFSVHYQPQVDASGHITGAEALVRWEHPLRGLVSPAAFIPLAEDTGLIIPLGNLVLQTVCTQLSLWAKQPSLAQLTVAVNISPHQFRQSGFVDEVLQIVAASGADPQRLKLELTERVMVTNVEDIITKMQMLKQQGIGFSLDDFGTGYSSLSYLKRLPLDQLKIDGGFVRDILTDSNDAAIAKMVVALGESMGLAVIAEGVETSEQRLLLAEYGCNAYQGYLFSRPLPVRDFEALLGSK